jgi:hypothetical protein
VVAVSLVTSLNYQPSLHILMFVFIPSSLYSRSLLYVVSSFACILFSPKLNSSHSNLAQIENEETFLMLHLEEALNLHSTSTSSANQFQMAGFLRSEMAHCAS